MPLDPFIVLEVEEILHLNPLSDFIGSAPKHI